MAEIKKRNGRWFARIPWRKNGKRYSKSKSGFATKALAKKWAVKQEDLLNKGVTINNSISFYDYYVRWFNTYKRPKVAQSTINRYTIDFGVIKDYFGSTELKKIDRTDYQRFINNYGSNHAPSSVRKLNSRLRACVKSAILDGFLIRDFTQSVMLAGNRNRTVQVQYLNVDEIKQLIKATKQHLNPRYTSRFMILTAIYTGMRKEEIQALTWQDINFRKKLIYINKAWREYPNENESEQHFLTNRFKKTKTSSSKRVIKVNDDLLNTLKILRHHSKSNMVFMDCFNTIPTSNALNKKLRELIASLGLTKKNFHFHSLRHSHVALLLAKGVDIYAISKRLGHSDISMTANTYAYLIDEYKAETDNQIANILDNL